jgi:hypothetical protein
MAVSSSSSNRKLVVPLYIHNERMPTLLVPADRHTIRRILHPLVVAAFNSTSPVVPTMLVLAVTAVGLTSAAIPLPTLWGVMMLFGVVAMCRALQKMH